MSRKTRRRLVPVSLVLALVLVAGFLAWPGTTTGTELDPCQPACGDAALACSIGCFEQFFRVSTQLWIQCELGCDAQLDACVAACQNG